MKILLVEDDRLIARDVSESLEQAGYVVEHVSDGKTAWFLGDTEEYTAIILDLGLPELDGLSVLRRWRANDRNQPILVLTARGDWSERVEGIDAGADDYLGKPFQMEELLARLRAIIRRSAGQSSSIISCGVLRVDQKLKTVTLDGAPVKLTPMEFRCLNYLMLRAGTPVSQIELTEQLYSQDFERDSNSVEVLIGRLRKKLGKGVINTKRGYGYIIETETS